MVAIPNLKRKFQSINEFLATSMLESDPTYDESLAFVENINNKVTSLVNSLSF